MPERDESEIQQRGPEPSELPPSVQPSGQTTAEHLAEDVGEPSADLGVHRGPPGDTVLPGTASAPPD